ncbi:MAG: response regulator [Pseudomonadota bacterium]|nr:response regulator [Pseudomonadota bacterium]
MTRDNSIVGRERPIRILAVDDNPAALYATSRVLKSAGYEVIQGTTGAEALAKAKLADLIVLDVNLPDLDGFEVCRRLRANPATAQLPVLHLSATFTQVADLAMGIEAGADSYLTRPVEAPVLLATVRTLMFARQADKLRRGADAKLRAMFDLAPVGIVFLDELANYTSVNPAFCKMTGYSTEQLVGRSLSYSLATALHLAELSEALKGSAVPWKHDVKFQKRDGNSVEMEWQITQEDVSGTSVLIAIDITQRLRAEKARESLLTSERAARAEAERSNRAKEEFLATISHELRNPLHAIVGWATILNRNPDLTEPVRRGLQSIERNSKLQARMISDLLDYAGITFGRIRCVPEHIDPYPIIRAALDIISATALAADVNIQTSFEDESLRVDADPARLQQIILNLLSNAVKFSEKKGVVHLSAGQVGDNFQLLVSDEGRGIEPQFLPRIFERFSQQDATTSKAHGGLGLGLAIVKQLVDLHGGSIEASSAGRGCGAAFKVLLPLSQRDEELQESDSQLLRNIDFSRIVVLIVDDDADSRALTARVLSDVGATVIEADDAAAGIASVQSRTPSLLISDIGMAHRDGYELLRALREAGYDELKLPAIALTAFSRMEDRTQALAAGFQEHLVKPLDPQLLVSTVAYLCRPARS